MEIKFRNVVAFRTEDPKFPAANLLQGGKWLSERKSRSSVNDVTLCLGEAHLISHIDVGNWGSSFITIEVSQVGLHVYQTLLPTTEIMSGRDAQVKKNWASVHMFSKEHFVEDVLEQKWNVVRVTCLQPFLQNEQFGLSFFKIFSMEENELPAQPEPQSPPPGSVFQIMRDCTLAKVSPPVKTRSQQLVLAAKDKQRTSLKCSSDTKQATVPSSSNARESSSVKTDTPLNKTNYRTNILNGSAQESLYNNKTDSRLARARHSSSSTVNIQKCTPPSDAAEKIVEALRKKRKTSFLSPSGSENNVISPVSNATHMRKLSSSGKRLKLLQRQVNSIHGRNKDQEIDDSTVVSDSDSESSIVVLPLAAVSPSRELRDFDSDTEAVVIPSDETHDKMHDVKIVTSSSPKQSYSNIPCINVDAVPGPSRIACPLCSDYFDASSIEQHAATCGLTSEMNDSICPICSRFFPPEILPEHADLCAERTRV